MKTGDVFSAILSPGEPKRHFWVIILAITEEGNAILGNITSNCFDKTLSIYDKEYSELTNPISYVNYPAARIESIASLKDKLASRQIFKKQPVSDELLKQIQEGLLLSKYTPRNVKQLAKKYLK